VVLAMKCRCQTAKIRWEHRRFLSDRSRSCAGSNRPTSQLTVWTCSQTSRRHTCPPSLAVPHRSVTRSPSGPELEVMSRPPSKQVAWPTLQGQQYTSCWPLETSRHQGWKMASKFLRFLKKNLKTSSPKFRVFLNFFGKFYADRI